jgi:predicted esterase
MKFLCLHGAYGSAKNFEVQLKPFIEELENTTDIEFKWIDGMQETQPPVGFENYFGSGQLYRHMEFDGISELDDMLARIREFPEGMSAEDTMRQLVGEKEMFSANAVHSCIDRLFKMLEEDPEIDGILGYSEGATTAATMVLEEQRRFEEEGRPRQLKAGIFFAGWPPVKLVNGNVRTMLSDECEDMIDIPSCHIVGCNDPYLQGAMALFTMCDEDTTVLFDHGKGHTVPRDQRTVKELAGAIQDTVRRAEALA